MGLFKPPKVQMPPMPEPAQAPPPFISQPKPTKKKSSIPTFLGTEMTPTGAMGGSVVGGGKTLLGQ